MIHVGRKGKYYTLNGEIVKPDEFFGIDGFKFANHAVAWANGGGGAHLDNARRYIEEEVLGNGCRRMRAPVEFLFWTGPYFNLLESNPAPYNVPNVANTMELVDLTVGTGSAFFLTPLLRKVIRLYVCLAREYDIVIEVPWLWTIKGRAGKKTPFHPDPREENGRRVSAWNEHFLAAHGIGAYLEELYTEGGGEGEARVDPGGLNIMSDMMNEYTAHADVWTDRQLRNVARRWQTRDAPSQPVNLISQSNNVIEYDPPLESQAGDEGYDGPCLHPPRSGEWKQSGRYMRQKWPDELIDANESMLAMTQEQRDFWVPLVPKWAGLGTTNMTKWGRMLEIMIEHEIYVTPHTFRGMDAGWPWTAQTVVEETVRGITNTTGPPPPPPPPPPKVYYDRLIHERYRVILGRDADTEGLRFYNLKMRLFYEEGDTARGWSLKQVDDDLIRSKEFKKENTD